MVPHASSFCGHRERVHFISNSDEVAPSSTAAQYIGGDPEGPAELMHFFLPAS